MNPYLNSNNSTNHINSITEQYLASGKNTNFLNSNKSKNFNLNNENLNQKIKEFKFTSNNIFKSLSSTNDIINGKNSNSLGFNTLKQNKENSQNFIKEKSRNSSIYNLSGSINKNSKDKNIKNDMSNNIKRYSNDREAVKSKDLFSYFFLVLNFFYFKKIYKRKFSKYKFRIFPQRK